MPGPSQQVEQMENTLHTGLIIKGNRMLGPGSGIASTSAPATPARAGPTQQWPRLSKNIVPEVSPSSLSKGVVTGKFKTELPCFPSVFLQCALPKLGSRLVHGRPEGVILTRAPVSFPASGEIPTVASALNGLQSQLSSVSGCY